MLHIPIWSVMFNWKVYSVIFSANTGIKYIQIHSKLQITTGNSITLQPKVEPFLLPHGYSELYIRVNSKSVFI